MKRISLLLSMLCLVGMTTISCKNATSDESVTEVTENQHKTPHRTTAGGLRRNLVRRARGGSAG